MFRSPADKIFLKKMATVILVAECVIIGASYILFGPPYWPIMAILAGAAMFAAVVGFSVLFSPDYNVFSPWPSSIRRPLPRRGDTNYPGYGPHEDPNEPVTRRREAAERMARDKKVALWLGLTKQGRVKEPTPDSGGSAHLMWVLGPLLAVVLVVALLVWGGIESTP